MILSVINHPFGGTPIYGSPPNDSQFTQIQIVSMMEPVSSSVKRRWWPAHLLKSHKLFEDNVVTYYNVWQNKNCWKTRPITCFPLSTLFVLAMRTVCNHIYQIYTYIYVDIDICQVDKWMITWLILQSSAGLSTTPLWAMVLYPQASLDVK